MGNTFFSDTDIILAGYSRRAEVEISREFYLFMGRRFNSLFVEKTGIKPVSKIQLLVRKPYNGQPMYQKGIISRFSLPLQVGEDFKQTISFCWQSTDGNIISMSDKQFDEDKLVCWIEGLTPDIYKKLLRKKKTKHPFTTKGLPFKVSVFDYAYTMHLYITLDGTAQAAAINEIIDKTIAEHNSLADALHEQDDALSSVHNWQITAENNQLIVYMDAANEIVINKILKALANFATVKAVALDL